MTCIGNSGPLPEPVDQAIKEVSELHRSFCSRSPLRAESSSTQLCTDPGAQKYATFAFKSNGREYDAMCTLKRL